MENLITTAGSLDRQMNPFLPLQKFKIAGNWPASKLTTVTRETKSDLFSGFRKFFASGMKTKMFVMYLQAIEIFYIIYK